MKTSLRQLLFGAALACFGMLAFATAADTPPPPADAKEAPSAAAAPAAASTTVTSTTTSVAPAPAPAVPEPPSAPTAAGSTTPATPATAPATPAAAPATPAAPTEAAAPTSPEPAAKPPLHRIDEFAWDQNTSGMPQPRVAVFNNAFLGKDETAAAVVSVFGNSTSEGKVLDSVVSVFGNSRATGPVRNAVVSIFGNTYVDSEVHEAVAVFGSVQLGPNAKVHGDVVPVFGTVNSDPKATVEGNMAHVNFGPFSNFEWLQSYVEHCVRWVRPLAIAPHLGWAWSIAASFLIFYALVALLFHAGVDKCALTLETRPGASILTSIVALILMPVIVVLLCLTVVGIVVLPCLMLFGRVVTIAWLGRQVLRLARRDQPPHAALAVLVGGIIVLGLYLVPVLGFVTYQLIGFLGFGVVILTLFASLKRNKPAPVAAVGGVPVAPAPAFVPPVIGAEGAGVGGAGVAAVAEPLVTAAVPPVAVATLPRAGFWIRTAALLIDIILVAVVYGIVGSVLHIHGGPFLLVLATYGAVMWKFKGTTIGGIVCGLRVVRLDGRPLDWTTAIVRALGCFLSLIVVGFGFIWVAVDDEKQSWHDKIAGTTVVCGCSRNSLV